MLDPLLHLFYILAGMTVFFSLLPLLVAVLTRDRTRVERLADIYTDVFVASAAAIIGAIKVSRNRGLRPPNAPTVPPPNTS
jgi:hypothetical protein